MINFTKNQNNTVDVYSNDEQLGYLEFDQEQEAWVYWTKGADDMGFNLDIAYYEDLKETEDTIAEEIADFYKEA